MQHVMVEEAAGRKSDAGRYATLVVVPDLPSEVSTRIALQSLVDHFHEKSGHADHDGVLMWPLAECRNPVCVRAKQLIEQLEELDA